MKLYPHKVADTVSTISSPNLFGPEFSKTWPVMRSLIDHAVTFDFGEAEPSPEHTSFGLDLIERGLFRLPYKVVAYSVLRKAQISGKKLQTKTAGLFICTQHEDESGGGLSIFICGPTQDQHGRIDGGIPTAAGFHSQVTRTPDTKDGTADVAVDGYPIVSKAIVEKMWGDELEMNKRIAQATLHAIGMTVMLMSKGVETAFEPAPTKLNRARSRKGRAPIGPRYTVQIDPARARTINNLDGSEDDITGHTRHSPRPHWRRGHFRTLQTGLVIPVAPAMVGISDGNVPRPAYELAQLRQPQGAHE